MFVIVYFICYCLLYLFVCRKQYDVAVNTVTLTIHPAPYYVLRGGALQNKMVSLILLNKVWHDCGLFSSLIFVIAYCSIV